MDAFLINMRKWFLRKRTFLEQKRQYQSDPKIEDICYFTLDEKHLIITRNTKIIDFHSN